MAPPLVVGDKTLIYALSGAIACLLLVILGALVAWLVNRRRSSSRDAEMMSARSDRFVSHVQPYGDFSPIVGVAPAAAGGYTFTSTASTESHSQYVALPAGASPPPSESSSNQNNYHNLAVGNQMQYGTLHPEN
jgi:hypothetical protein